MTTAARSHLSTRGLLRGLVLAAWVLIPDAQAQSPASPVANDLFPAELFAPLPAPRRPSSDLAIVFWLDSHDPLGTLHHQTYDRRKGEYTPAVDDWLRTIEREYPSYVAYLRYVDVGKRNVAEVVRETVAAERDELVAGLAKRRSLSGSSRLIGPVNPRPRPSVGASPFRHPIGIRGAPGSSGMSPGATSSYPFPTPFPYPRPHP